MADPTSGTFGCIFCRWAEDTRHVPADDLLYEDDDVLIVLDEDWVVPGHTLVIWKAHRENVSDLTPTEYARFAAMFHRCEAALRASLGTDSTLVLKSGGLVRHFHFHSYPLIGAVSLERMLDLLAKRVRHRPRPGEHQRLVASVRSRMRPGQTR